MKLIAEFPYGVWEVDNFGENVEVLHEDEFIMFLEEPDWCRVVGTEIVNDDTVEEISERFGLFSNK